MTPEAPMPEDDRWLSVEEIAHYLGVSRDAVYAWLSKEGLPGHKMGRLWKFKRDEVDAWVRAGAASSNDTDAEADADDLVVDHSETKKRGTRTRGSKPR